MLISKTIIKNVFISTIKVLGFLNVSKQCWFLKFLKLPNWTILKKKKNNCFNYLMKIHENVHIDGFFMNFHSNNEQLKNAIMLKVRICEHT